MESGILHFPLATLHFPLIVVSIHSLGPALRTGQVLGQTDARGEQVIGNPIRMQSVLNAVYGMLGVDPATTFEDFSGRPQYLLDDRGPLPGLV